jgi:hypothetical protein
MFPAAMSYATTTSFLPEHDAVLRKAMEVLYRIGAGELVGEEAAVKAREVMVDVDAIPRVDEVYMGEIVEWDEVAPHISYPISIRRQDNGALYVSIGDPDDYLAAQQSPQLGLLLEVNSGRPCVHVWGDATCTSSSVVTFFGQSNPTHYSPLIRMDGELGPPEADWQGTGWSVRPVIGDRIVG